MGDPPSPFDRPRTIASSDGVDLAVYDLDGVGPDLLLVHATGFCAGVWEPLADRLDGFRRAALDVRGHGRSSVPADGMSWEGTGDDVLATIDALGLVRPAGVGHSMGGASLLLAELARPGTFRSLWLFEPIVFPAPLSEGPDNFLAAGARRRRPEFPSRRAAVDNFAAKAPLDELDRRSLEAYVRFGFEEREDGSVTLRCRPEVEAATFEMGPRHRTWDHLGQVGCPVTVVRGRPDGPGPASLTPGIVERLPHGRQEDHPELGHFGPLQDLDGMAASIRAAVTGPA
jgi:pimeloyl-ACP methyl ester carboxylesterase